MISPHDNGKVIYLYFCEHSSYFCLYRSAILVACVLNIANFKEKTWDWCRSVWRKFLWTSFITFACGRPCGPSWFISFLTEMTKFMIHKTIIKFHLVVIYCFRLHIFIWCMNINEVMYVNFIQWKCRGSVKALISRLNNWILLHSSCRFSQNMH